MHDRPKQTMAYPSRLLRQLVPVQAHRVGQGHGLGRWWEPAATSTCTSLFNASDVLQKPCDIFKISEIEVQKGLSGLLPRPGTLSSSTPSFLVGLLRAHVYAARATEWECGATVHALLRTV
jgi:hypothetical protein